jgi:hypothetical protein
VRVLAEASRGAFNYYDALQGWKAQEGNMRSLIEITAVVLVAAVVTIVIHELGHVLAIVALRWKVTGVGLVSWRSFAVGADPTGEAAQSAAIFGRGLRMVALCGPLANMVAAVVLWLLAWLFRAGMLHHGLTPAIVLLAMGIGQLGGALQLIPTKKGKGKAGYLLGNDGDLVFRAFKDQALLDKLLSE